MAYTFTKDLETGNQLIDTEHRQLIDAINNLLSACATGKGRTELAHTTKFLQDYTAKHFSDEEKLQLQSQYPDYVNHRRYHEDFKKVVAGICQKLERDGATVSLVGEVNSTIAGWLINHIKKEDVKVANHLKSRS
ncbi:bacteriohemerythrin [Clostridium sp. HBUAS56010]|uniref:bacteriohemerythrin n=1 Tax=Clostridium sp. HBUAS56010 TaxID=2571127 RepID=UPI001177CB3B|nr:bacteriohemerythrin [Clostridium sp. HBUAS56010]